MVFLRLFAILTLLFVLPLSGCYNKAQRHLASDAGLVTVGSSTRNDVLTYLGEPDKQRNFPENGTEEWIYREEKPSGYQRVPLVGGFFSGNGFDTITVVFKDNIVQSCVFKESDEDEFNWADDYSWQEKTE